MQRSDGKDIVKKMSARKGRYLLVFNFQLAPAAAGRFVRAVGGPWWAECWLVWVVGSGKCWLWGLLWLAFIF